MHQAPSSAPSAASSHLEQDNIPLIILISVIAAIGGFLIRYEIVVINGTTVCLKKAF